MTNDIQMKNRKQQSARKTLKQRASIPPRKIFIVEDHPVFRQGLRQMVNLEEDLNVCGEAGDYDEALKGITRLKPDLALVDITLPGKSGLDLIKKLRSANDQIKLLIVSMHDEALYADRVLRAGGDGYIMKQEDPDEIIHAIRDVLGGHVYVSEEVLADHRKATSQRPTGAKARLIDQLTDSELEILELLGRGKSNQEISRQLGLGVRAVSARSRQIKRKLNLKSVNELIRYAVCWVETGAG
jgi:DNA-binding NarL/FixJ family response regulator